MAISPETSEVPPNCGKRLAAHYIHQVAIDDPHRICISIPLTSEPRDGFEDITFCQLDKAIDVASIWVEKEIGIGKDYESIAYIGPHDLRYIVLMIAAIKTGHKLFVPSPRNSLEAHVKLLKDYRCENFLFAGDSPSSRKILNGIQSQIDLRTIGVPNLDYFLHPPFDVPHYEYTATYDEARFEPFVAMHTSGTTGTPKPIVIPQGVITGLDASQKASSLYGIGTGSDYWRGLRCFLTFPLFHAAGVSRLMTALFFNQVAVLPPPVPLTAEIANEVHMHGNVQAADMPPSVLVDISKVSEYLDNLRHLTHIMTGGGPLPNRAGDIINSYTRLFVSFGSTETGHIQGAVPPKENWDYFDFSTAFGVEMRHHSDELYEFVIIRDPSVEAYQGIFYTFPDLLEYKTRDLFSKHPTKKNLWRHEGRSDDIIVYSTGEKFNPISMENALNSHPEVKTAIVYGTKKFQSSLLIEPADPEKSKESLLDEIWPTVKTANSNCPAHARIMSKDFVTFTKRDKPIPRAGKGTVQRKQAEKLYETELNDLYEPKSARHHTNGVNTNGNSCAPHEVSSDLQSTILQTVSSLPGFENFSSSDDFFEQGLDSLGVISLARALNSVFESQSPPRKSIPESMIYANPSAEKLTRALSGAAKNENGNHDEMKKEYERFVFDLPIVARPLTPAKGPKVFLLTGSTGSLGSYILSTLLEEDKSCKIYCLNRGEDSKERQHRSNTSKGLTSDFERVEFISMATAPDKPWLGMKIAEYKKLLNEVTHIIHNAWHVDFNVSLSQLSATHLRRVRQLIDFSAHSKYGCSIHFISSISTVGNWDIINANKSSSSTSSDDYATQSHPNPEQTSEQHLVPELPFEDWSLPQGLGYGQSKFIAERLFITACRISHIPVSIYRVGQIAGPITKNSKGKWNEQEWFPLILKSSKYMKILPSTLGPLETVDWIPVDILGNVIYELVTTASSNSNSTSRSQISDSNDSLMASTTTSTSPQNPIIYHLTNPHRTTYSRTILPHLKSLSEFALPIVSFSEWVRYLRDTAAVSTTKTSTSTSKSKISDDEKINNNPAIKILSFYEDLVQRETEGRMQVALDTRRAVEGSRTLRGLREVDDAWVGGWLGQWGYVS